MEGKVSKIKLNISIDIIMLIVLMALTGIGFMIKYILVPGFLRNEIYGENTELYFMGLDRHQWGTIHLVIGFIFLFLLVLHIIYHWKLIVTVIKAMLKKRNTRIAFVVSFVFLALLLALSPLFINPVIKEGQAKHHNQWVKHNIEIRKDSALVLKHKPHQHRNDKEVRLPENSAEKGAQNAAGEKKMHKHISPVNIEVYGYMTLNEVADKFKISSDKLALCIGVSKENAGEKLGRLRKRYDFDMEDLRTYIEENIQ